MMASRKNDNVPRVTIEMQQGSKTRCILIVSNNVRMQATLAVLLKDNCLVSTALTAAEGFLYLHAYVPALVILDLRLPDLHGLFFLQTLRGRSPICPVIVTGVSESTTDLQEIARLGVEGVYPEPPQIDELLDQIHAIFFLHGSSLPFTPSSNLYTIGFHKITCKVECDQYG